MDWPNVHFTGNPIIEFRVDMVTKARFDDFVKTFINFFKKLKLVGSFFFQNAIQLFKEQQKMFLQSSVAFFFPQIIYDRLNSQTFSQTVHLMK